MKGITGVFHLAVKHVGLKHKVESVSSLMIGSMNVLGVKNDVEFVIGNNR